MTWKRSHFFPTKEENVHTRRALQTADSLFYCKLFCCFFPAVFIPLVVVGLNFFASFFPMFSFEPPAAGEVADQSPCTKCKRAPPCVLPSPGVKMKLFFYLTPLSSLRSLSSVSARQDGAHRGQRSVQQRRRPRQRHGGAQRRGEDGRVRRLRPGARLLRDGPAGDPHLQHPEEEGLPLLVRQGGWGRGDGHAAERR